MADQPSLVGRCGEQAPRIFADQHATFCRLPHGHAGWHKADDGSEWNEVAGSDDSPPVIRWCSCGAAVAGMTVTEARQFAREHCQTAPARTTTASAPSEAER